MRMTIERTQSEIEKALESVLRRHYTVHSVAVKGRRLHGETQLHGTAVITNRANDAGTIELRHDEIMLALDEQLAEQGYVLEQFVSNPVVSGTANSMFSDASYRDVRVTFVYDDKLTLTNNGSGN